MNSEVCTLFCHQWIVTVALTLHSVSSLAAGSAFLTLFHLTLQSCCVPWYLLYDPYVCIAVAACLNLFNAKHSCKASCSCNHSVDALLWYLFLQWEGKPFTHIHSRATSLGVMSKSASCGIQLLSGLERRKNQLGLCVCYITVAFGYVFARVLWNTEGLLR